MEENKVNLPLLVEQLETGNGVIPFVGAGLSIPLGFPGWTEFLKEQGQSAGIKKKIENRINAGEYEEAAEDLLNALKSRAFQDHFKYAYGDRNLENKELSGAVSLLPQLASGPVITTNFDHVLENIFKKYNYGFEHKVLGAKVDLVPEALQGNKRFLLKIHGDVDDRTERILTLSEYEQNYGSTDTSKINMNLPLPSLLRLMLTNRPLLFLGCSLNKDRTIETLKKVAQDYPGIAHFAILEKPSSEALFHEKVSYLSEHGIRPIWYPTGQHDLIKSLLEYLINRIPSSSKIMPQQFTNNRLLSRPNDYLLQEKTSPLRIFLCHSSEDKPEVRNLYQRLSSDGFDPWLDEKNILGGQKSEFEIVKAVKNSDVVIVCLSHKAINKAGYFHKQIKYALDKEDEQPEDTIYLIPLKLEECNVPERLQDWHWINLFEEKGYEQLTSSLRSRAEIITSRSDSEPNIIQRHEFLEKNSLANYETKSIKEIYGLLPPFANAKMFGRDDKFNRIKEILEKNNHVFIYGEHGIGKTMLAAKICKVFEKPCLWYSVRTEDVALPKVYGDILQLLEVEDFPNENQVENKIKERIIDNQIKAIFLDNIDSIEIIKKFLSFCNTIEKPLIVTSHCTNINGEFDRNNKFKLEIFDDKNIAKELFKAHLPEIELKDDDEEIIDNICKNLDYHPFDIKIVAPQMEFYFCLSDLKEALLDEENTISIFKDANDSNPYLSHYKSLNLTYNNLNEDNQKLFSIIASFPSKSVSESLINYFSELNLHFPKNLIRFSIINMDKENKKYEVHHITHLFIIEKLREMEEVKKENNFTNKIVKNMIIKSLMNYIDDNSDWDNPSHRENIRTEMDNILGAMKWCHLSKDVNNLIEFENIMRHYLYVFGEWDERIKWSQRVWDLRNNKYLMTKKGYRILMAGVEGLCFVYLQRGEVEEVNNILDIAQKHLPLNTENREWQRVWCFYHRVKGMLNYNMDLFEEAKNNFETSIEFAKKSDWETMEIPIGIQLGMPYFKQKKYDDAINILNNCINHAYEHYKRKPKESPPCRRIMRAFIWLGKCYCEKGCFEESRKQFMQSEKLYIDNGGLSEPLLINDLYFEWGLLEKISKNYETARKLITLIDEDVRYYWSDEKSKTFNKIKDELEIN